MARFKAHSGHERPKHGAWVILTTDCWVDIAFYNAKTDIFVGEQDTPADDVKAWAYLRKLTAAMITAVKA